MLCLDLDSPNRNYANMETTMKYEIDTEESNAQPLISKLSPSSGCETHTQSSDDAYDTPQGSFSSLNGIIPNHVTCSPPMEYDSTISETGTVYLRRPSKTIGSKRKVCANNRKEKTNLFSKCSQCCRCKRTQKCEVNEEYELTQTQQNDSDIYTEFSHEEPLRKRILRACLTLIYFLLASIAVIVTYSMVSELIHAMNNPVRSIHYKKSGTYDAPGESFAFA